MVGEDATQTIRQPIGHKTEGEQNSKGRVKTIV